MCENSACERYRTPSIGWILLLLGMERIPWVRRKEGEKCRFGEARCLVCIYAEESKFLSCMYLFVSWISVVVHSLSESLEDVGRAHIPSVIQVFN